MPSQITEMLEVLRNTPATLSAMLKDLSPNWTHANYGPDTFSPFDVIGHLIHGEKTDWIPRLRILLEHGEARPFEPFDRFAMYEIEKGRSLSALLEEFATLRSENVSILTGMNLTDDQLEQTGMHPALGRIAARQLLSAWVVHDLNHIHQIAKCMAYQYRNEAGPFADYLGILKGLR